jgi:threonine/homoserine/homoserine lactone efflux protein
MEARFVVDLGILATFAAAVLGLCLVPGPAVLLTLARAVGGGRRIGVATGLGIVAGDLVHAAMATVGLSALLMTSALAFQVVKYLGVAYLCYLGLRLLLERTEALAIPSARLIAPSSAFRQPMLTEVLNPKTALFFLAFLPQFVRSEKADVALQLGVLGLVFVLVSAVYITLVAFGAGSFGRWLARHRNVGRWQGKIVGGIYLGLGVKLALQER